MERHFTVSGFLVDGGRTALHWHRKLQIWLPPGGHVDPDEDMVQAVVREVLEETGISAEIVPANEPLPFDNVPQLPPPLAIIIGAVPDGPHEHIDMSYALRPLPDVECVAAEEGHEFIWVSAEQLRSGDPLPVTSCGVDMPVPEDVRVIGIRAIELVRERSQLDAGE